VASNKLSADRDVVDANRDLIHYLARPLKEAENKLLTLESKLKQLEGSQEQRDKELSDSKASMKSDLESVAAHPRQLEQRISSLEGLAKHIPEMRERIKDQGRDMHGNVYPHLKSLESDLSDMRDRTQLLEKEIRSCAQDQKAHRERLCHLEDLSQRLERSLKEIPEKFNEQRNSLNEAKLYFEGRILEFKNKLSSSIESALHKIDNVNQRVSSSDKGLQTQLVELRSDVNFNIDDARQKLYALKELVQNMQVHEEDYSQGIADSLKDLRRGQDMLDERLDKFSLVMKELKAAAGV